MPVPPPDPQPGSPARAVLGVCLLAAVVLGLHLLVPPALAAPDLTAPGTWLDWATSRSPVLVAMALVRVLALGLAWYLLAVTSLQVVAVVTDTGWLAALASTITPTTARHLATAVVGAGVMAATPVASVHGAAFAGAPGSTGAAVATDSLPAGAPGRHDVPHSAAQPTAPPPSLRRAAPTGPPDQAPSSTGPPRLRRAGPSPGVTPAPTATPPTSGRRTPGDTVAGAADATRATHPADGGGTDRVEVTDDGHDATPATPGTWTVVAGDHFWGVAEREVARRLGRVPSEDEVTTWWRQLVEVNRDRLVDPGNPDLILPGQVMRFPSPTSGVG